MTTIVLGRTVLVTTVEGMASLMVSPQSGTIVRTDTLLKIITGKVKAARYQGSNPNRYNNEGNGSNHGSQRCRKGQNRRPIGNL